MGATTVAPMALLRSEFALADTIRPAANANSASSLIAAQSQSIALNPPPPRFFCQQNDSFPKTMARRGDGITGPIIDWSAAWTTLSNPPVSLNERCEQVANRLRVIQARDGSFRITAGRFNNRPSLCVAQDRGVCAPDGLIMTTESLQAAEEGVRALQTSFQELMSAAGPAAAPNPTANLTPNVPNSNSIALNPNSSNPSGPNSTSPPIHIISTDSQPIAVAVNFYFQNVLEYSNCLEDIILLYQNPMLLNRQGRRSNCLPDVFSAYALQGLSQSQALELITAANQYALNPASGRWLFPPAGLRARIKQLFEFTYEIDTQQG